MKSSLVFHSLREAALLVDVMADRLAEGREVPALVDGRSTEIQGRYGIHRYKDTVIRPTPAADAARVDKMIEEANAGTVFEHEPSFRARLRRNWEK